MPAPILLAPLAAALIRGLMVMISMKAVLWVVKVMGLLGIAFATNEYVVEPLLDLVVAQWNALPPEITQWLRAFGVTEVASMMVSAYTIVAAQRVFLTAVQR